MRAMQIAHFGGPEVFEIAEVPVPSPDAGEDLVRLDVRGSTFPTSRGGQVGAVARFPS